MTAHLPAGSVIRVSAATMDKMKDLFKNGRTVSSGGGTGIPKIALIKIVRREGKTFPASEENLSLRDSKQAVERWISELEGEPGLLGDRRPRILVNMILKNITADFGEGDVVIDLEELQFRALAGLTSIGFEEAGRMLDLIGVLRAWESGEKIGVISSGDGLTGCDDSDSEWI